MVLKSDACVIRLDPVKLCAPTYDLASRVCKYVTGCDSHNIAFREEGKTPHAVFLTNDVL